MSYDRIIHFNPGETPNYQDIGKALEDYLGGIKAGPAVWEGSRWTVLIKGSSSWPFRRLEDADQLRRWNATTPAERWIEVFVDDDSVDVITRHQDELVNNVAGGFAKLVARYWRGRLDDDPAADKMTPQEIAEWLVAHPPWDAPSMVRLAQAFLDLKKT